VISRVQPSAKASTRRRSCPSPGRLRGVGGSVLPEVSATKPRTKSGRLTTYSIVARCAKTGQLGGAVSTADVGAGRLVLWARAGSGVVATQSWLNVYLAIDALLLMSRGEVAPNALADVMKNDPESGVRQVGLVDHTGGSSAWTGRNCTEWAGHIVGDGYAVQGNMLVGRETVEALSYTFLATEGCDLAERLLQSLEAAQAAGGDKRGRQCSALLVVDHEEFPLWDLRVDEHPEPVAELRRIHDIARAELLPLVQGLPTREHPEGSYTEDFASMILLPPSQRPLARGYGHTHRRMESSD